MIDGTLQKENCARKRASEGINMMPGENEASVLLFFLFTRRFPQRQWDPVFEVSGGPSTSIWRRERWGSSFALSLSTIISD